MDHRVETLFRFSVGETATRPLMWKGGKAEVLAGLKPPIFKDVDSPDHTFHIPSGEMNALIHTFEQIATVFERNCADRVPLCGRTLFAVSHGKRLTPGDFLGPWSARPTLLD